MLPLTTDYRPAFSLSKGSFKNGYPMVQYLVKDKLGNVVEISEPRDPTEMLYFDPKPLLQTPIKMIDKTITPTIFFQLCKKYPKYQLNHADRSLAKAPTALAMAVSNGNLKLVVALLNCIADKTMRRLFVNQCMTNGYTAIFSVKTDQLEPWKSMKILQTLIEAGANLEISPLLTLHALHSHTFTPLINAIISSDHLLIQNLILMGAKLPNYYKIKVQAIEMLGLEQISLIREHKLFPPKSIKSDDLSKIVKKIIKSKSNEIFPGHLAMSFHNQFQQANARIKEKYTIVLLSRDNQRPPNEWIFNHSDICKFITSIFITISFPAKPWLQNQNEQSLRSTTTRCSKFWFKKFGRTKMKSSYKITM